MFVFNSSYPLKNEPHFTQFPILPAHTKTVEKSGGMMDILGNITRSVMLLLGIAYPASCRSRKHLAKHPSSQIRCGKKKARPSESRDGLKRAFRWTPKGPPSFYGKDRQTAYPYMVRSPLPVFLAYVRHCSPTVR